MGEIKSTLDLVMEKTKHLSLSDEEKQNQKKIESQKRINGLLQKYQDQVLSMEQLHTEYNLLKKEFKLFFVIGKYLPTSFYHIMYVLF